MTRIDLDRRLRELAGDRPAFIGIDPSGDEETLSWRALDERSRGFSGGSVEVVPAAGNAESLIRLVAVLRSGSVALVVDPGMPDIRAVANQVAAMTGWAVCRDGVELAAGSPVSVGGSLLLTGGTSGVPKPVLRPGMPYWDTERRAPLLFARTGWRIGQVQLLTGAWYHAAPYTHLIEGLLSGNTLVCPRVFDPHVVLGALRRHRPQWTQLTPSHMQLLVPHLPDDAVTSLRGVLHTAGPCAPRTRQAWIGAIGADRLFEMYAATEGIGVTLCRADEWQARPGTVGRGFCTRIRVYDDAGIPLPAGEVGTVYMRTIGPSPLSAGAADRDGYRTVGDIGHLDDDGYLFLAGRRDDMVIVGGENVHTDRIAGALLGHEQVADAAVVAVPDDNFGDRIVALVVPTGNEDIRLRLLTYCVARLSPAEIPTEIRLVPSLRRTSAGKVRPDVLADLAC